MRISKLLSILLIAVAQGAAAKDDSLAAGRAVRLVEQYVGAEAPGPQYAVVTAERMLFAYAGGWADIQNQKAMESDSTLMAYSMTKAMTAVAVLQLVDRGKLSLDDSIDRYLPDSPYHGQGITVRQLLNHTSGVPNPIPLRWVHLAAEDADFDEAQALADVLREHPALAFGAGQKYAYSNIGYWLLGKVIEKASGQSYPAYMRANVLRPLGLSPQEMDFVIPDPQHHAKGYLAKYSWMNLAKGFLIDRKFFGDYEGNWLHLEDHYLNGPAFGGLIGTAQGFSRFLQDQLRAESVLFTQGTKHLLQAAQTDGAGQPLRMTLGWHLGETDGEVYLFKEGGGGGFHSEMRLYPRQGIGTVVLANSTGFHASQFLNRVDRLFFESR